MARGSSRARKNANADRPGVADPTAPLEGGELLTAARPVLSQLRTDLEARASDPGVTRALELRYEDIRVQPTPTGFVQQHVLCCRSATGVEVRAHACLVATVEDGRIRRLDEYLDAAAIAPLTGG